MDCIADVRGIITEYNMMSVDRGYIDNIKTAVGRVNLYSIKRLEKKFVVLLIMKFNSDSCVVGIVTHCSATKYLETYYVKKSFVVVN